MEGEAEGCRETRPRRSFDKGLEEIVMTQEEAKIKIRELVDKYELAKSDGKISLYTEEDTKKNFILPLFETLGWDVYSHEEVTSEEQVTGKRVDYGFYHDGRIKFYLEAKPLKADLHREEYAKQAIRYSWNKGVTWAILTDFEGLIVFNALSPEKSLHGKKYFEIPYTEYLERFDQLWLLSKEAFSKNLLDKEAERQGKKLQKVSVTESLSKDLNECREKLTQALITCNSTINTDLIDEGVQKLLDRLIFIRVAEDRKIEPPTLRPLINEWAAKGGKVSLYHSMIEKFRELDAIYNSNLFSEHPFEKWEDYSGATEEVIDILYGKKSYFEYDFSIIPADVLGSVYESYLGYKMQKAPKKTNLFGEVVELGKDAKKRKEHGIYYTPQFIVSYIVKNTLGPVLDKCENIQDLQRIKVVDPACGSGSFLVAAFQLILNKYESFGAKKDAYTKIQILKNNIYGVDLDQQAVELARLNLLLQTFDEKLKLPNLGANIKNGNSLISGTDKELRKYFGKNFRDKKPFNWEEGFPEAFKQGGFDAVIGNPPYIRNRELQKSDKDYFSVHFTSARGQYDIYQLFYELGINLLRNNGLIGFITSNKFTIANYGRKIREVILEKTKIISIVDVSNINVFKDASTYPYIVILEKEEKNQSNTIHCFRFDSENASHEQNVIFIEQDQIKETETKNFILKKDPDFFQKIEAESVKLGEIATIKETIHTGNIRKKLLVDSPIDQMCKKLLAGKDCHRYWFKWNGKYIRYDKSLIDRSRGEYANLVDQKYFEFPKILLREIALGIECYLDEEGYYTLNKVYSIQPVGEYSLYFLLAVLNSRLLSYYFRNKFEESHVQNGYLQFKKIYTSQIPIRKFGGDEKGKAQHKELGELGRKMLLLYKELKVEEENSEKWLKIKEEIEKTDKNIDQKVYQLYGLTEEEIGIVESH